VANTVAYYAINLNDDGKSFVTLTPAENVMRLLLLVIPKQNKLEWLARSIIYKLSPLFEVGAFP